MKIPQNPFNDALQTCLNNIEEFKKRVEKESELKKFVTFSNGKLLYR